jgi:protein TonB
MGKLVEIILMEESGREVLDQQAIDMIKKAVSQLPIKNALAKKSFVVTVPVSFRLAQ